MCRPAESIRQRLTHQEQRDTWLDDVGREMGMGRLTEAKVDLADRCVADQVFDRQVEGRRPWRESVEAAVSRCRIQVVNAANCKPVRAAQGRRLAIRTYIRSRPRLGETLNLRPIDCERD